MENRFYNRDFEDFVKQNADQYRMFPSEKVWENIHSNLHSRRKWYGFGLALLLLTVGTVTWVMLYHSAKSPSVAEYSPVAASPVKTEKKKSAPAFLGNTDKRITIQKRFVSSTQTPEQKLFTYPYSQYNDEEAVAGVDIEDMTRPEEVATVVPLAATPVQKHEVFKPVITYQKPVIAITKSASSPSADNKSNTALNQDVIAENNKKTAPAITQASNSKEAEDLKKETSLLTIESVVNSYQYKKPAKKLSWEIFFTPTITYRRLSENKDFITNAQTRSNSLNYTAFTNINNLVSHRPDIGIQFGFSAGYPVFKNINVIAGLQFNVSKYDIGAYYSNSEVATIALNNGPGATSVSTTTNYRNIITNGGNPDWIRNMYFTASAPVGIEWKLATNKPTQFGVRITGQPTYILSDKAYVLSTDYKNYAEVPSLIRKFNVNTGIEAYVTYKSGRLKWKIGPQARFQARSSFKSPYPVKERLYDFGLKVGIMLK